MSNPIATPVFTAYRRQVALSAATGAAISPIAFMAFGTSEKPASPDEDTALGAEFARIPVVGVVNGVNVTVTGVLTGALAGTRRVTEMAVFTASGKLVARRVMKPKEFEDFTELEIIMTLEY